MHMGDMESLWGRINPGEMGARAGRDPAPLRRRLPAGSSSRASGSALEYVTRIVGDELEDQPPECVAGAVDEVLGIYRDESKGEQQKRDDLNKILHTTISNERFIQLANLISKMPLVAGGGADAVASDGTLAVTFDDEDEAASDEDLIGVITDDGDGEDRDDGDLADAMVVEDPLHDGIGGRKKVNLEALAFPLGSHTMTNQRCVLPQETVRQSMPGYEEIRVPAPQPFRCSDEELISISNLPGYVHHAFRGVHSLNYIQSQVAPAVFANDDNILLCAPTGAGKTNVALLAILKEMARYDGRLGMFKALYIAPMKALVQEVVQSFTDRLSSGPEEVRVCELTGDAQSTRAELRDANVIVATPEKWDVVSRKANDLSYCRMVRLVIVDEIHLLHDERGPVLESIIMRLLADQQQRSEYLRIIGLSATLPNYQDVATFVRAPPGNTFMFDASHRPVPLAQLFVGLTEKKPLRRMHTMNEVCYRLVAERAGSTQTLVFVHSRKDTFKTAKMIVDRAVSEGSIGRFVASSESVESVNDDDDNSNGLQSPELRQIVKYGVGIHHAGMSRSDRLQVERWFSEGRLQLLVSTATLAWGVNLPAHTVIIKGTQVYRPDRGSWCELSGQDVLQMLGRAGRPQYDTLGEGIIITEHSELPFYMSLGTMQLPIESQMIAKLPDHLNAAIAYGLVDSLNDAVEWLRASYLHVRMLSAPLNYGSSIDRIADSLEDYCHSALLSLKRCKLCEYNAGSRAVKLTSLGRIASDFYLSPATAAIFGEHLCRGSLNEIDVLRIFSLAQDFKSIAVRKEEQLEITKLLERVPIPIGQSAEDPSAKANVLLQAFVSQLDLSGFALQADTLYVTQSAPRLLRAMLAIALDRALGRLARLVLSLCQSVDRRHWWVLSPVRQLALPVDLAARLERKDIPFSRLFDLDADELGELVRQPSSGNVIVEALESFPRVQLSAQVTPLSSDEICIELVVEPKWKRQMMAMGKSELFWVFIEDPDEGMASDLLAVDTVLFTQRSSSRPSRKSIKCRWTGSPVLFVTAVSDRWIGAEYRLPIALMGMKVPEKPQMAPLGLTDRKPVRLKDGQKLDIIMSNAYDAIEAVNCGKSAFVSAPIDSSELLRALLADCSRQKIVVLHPKRCFVDNIIAREINGKLTGDVQSDLLLIESNSIVCGALSDFEAVTRRWKNKKILQSIELVVVLDAHLMLTDPIVDVALSRMRYMQTQLKDFNVLCCSHPLVDGWGFGEWLVGASSLILPFDMHVRPLNVTIHEQSQTHVPSMVLSSARKAHSVGQTGVVIFVDGYKMAQQTALDISMFCGQKEIESGISTSDKVLQQTARSGIAVLHESLDASRAVIEMFNSGQLSHLVMSMDSIWSFSPSALRARHVCLLGTSYFDFNRNALAQYGEADLQRALLFASSAHIFCSKNAGRSYNDSLRPIPCESQLDGAAFADSLNAAIATKLVSTKQEALDLLTWTFMYWRLPKNPNYYGLDWEATVDPNLAISTHLSELVEDACQPLIDYQMIQIDEDNCLRSSQLGLIAAHYGVLCSTIDMFALSAQKSTRLKGILELISAATEFDSLLVVKHGERAVLEELSAGVPIELSLDKQFDDPHSKVFLLLQAHFSRSALTTELYHDQRSILTTAFRLASALFDVMASQSWLGAACAAAEFCQMLVQGLWEYDHPMLCIPHVTAHILSSWPDIKSVYDFVDCEDEQWKRHSISSNITDKAKQRAAIEAINRYPSLQVTAKASGSQSAVVVSVERDVESCFVIAPYYPAEKTEMWWIIVADASDALLAVKKIALSEEHNEIALPVEDVGNAARVLLLCDSYIGCDQEVVVSHQQDR